MGRYVINDDFSKAVKKSLPKWGEIRISNEYLDGVIKIKNYRKYHHIHEVDVCFVGKIHVKIYRQVKTWHDSSVLKKYNISKIKLNRFLRRTMLDEVQIRMNYFGVEIRDYYNIQKIKWE
jgi:hypothetical protein